MTPEQFNAALEGSLRGVPEFEPPALNRKDYEMTREEMGYVLMIWGAGLMFMGTCTLIGVGVGTLAGF